MASSPSSDAAPNGESAQGRRARLDARRRRRTRKVALALLTVAVIAGAAAGGFAFYNSEGTSKAGAAGPTATTAPDAADDAAGLPTAQVAALRKLDHAHPLKVWIGGDSLAGAFGFSLGDTLGSTGVARTLVDYKVSSGLWSNDIRNWSERAQEQMTKNNPELVVFMIGTNDTTQVNKVDANHDGVEDWVPEYRAKVDHEMQILIGDKHRQVIWLGAPTLGDEQLDANAVKVDKVFQEEAKKFAPDVVYVDTYKLFEGPDGTYSRYIVDKDGNDISARISDGVHFTPDGAKYLADAVFALIDGRWHLKQQADIAHPIAWAYADGTDGELVPGYTSRPQSRYGSSSYNGNGSSYNGNGNGNSSGNGNSQTTYNGGGSTNTTVYVSPVTSPPATNAPTTPHTKPSSSDTSVP